MTLAASAFVWLVIVVTGAFTTMLLGMVGYIAYEDILASRALHAHDAQRRAHAYFPAPPSKR